MIVQGKLFSLALVAGLGLMTNMVNAACSFKNSLGSGAYTDSSGVTQTFAQAANGQTSCTVTCDSAGETELYLRFDGNPADFPLSDGYVDNPSGCGITLNISSCVNKDWLGWRIISNDYTNLKISCTCSQTYNATNTTCFSGSTMVEVENKGEVAMSELKVGDRVYTETDTTGNHKYQLVYSFGHRNDNIDAHFYQLFTKGNPVPLEMTAQHLVFVVTPDGKQTATRADSVKVGDLLVQKTSEGQELAVKVTSISTTSKQGVYMPLTQDGTIVVNGGIKASSYVSISDQAPTVVKNTAIFNLDEQSLSHWWMSPHRMVCMGISERLCRATETDGEVLQYLMAGRDLAEFADPYGFVMRVIVLGVPTFLVFGLFNLMEWLFFGPALAPTGVLLVGLVWYHLRKTNLGKRIPIGAKKVV